MYGHRTGISSQASFKPFKVSFHYLGHALNLAVNDMVKMFPSSRRYLTHYMKYQTHKKTPLEGTNVTRDKK